MGKQINSPTTTPTTPATSITSPALAPGNTRLFDIIDKFRELGIHNDLSLPQLVVVGDQSSGKSSLLEGLTQLPFPVAGGLCTRFATQIIFRRTAPGTEEKFLISINPDESRPNHEQGELRKFNMSYDAFTAEEFKEVVEKATEAMGLPKPGDKAKAKRFSNDLLKVEISGPMHEHFSVIDLPGLFHSPTEEQTEEDKKMVKAMVKAHLQNERTIILAVANAATDIANQAVFGLAEETDPEGRRTLGILTKPDRVEKGNEQSILNVALNKVKVLSLGWFVVRNRSTEDINAGVNLEMRNENEKTFFSTSPWNTLPSGRVGIAPLKKHLRGLLDQHIRKEFPQLMKELDGFITSAERELKVLGPKRDTSDEQRQLLLQLATKYQGLSLNAILGNYRDEFFASEEHKLRMLIMRFNDEFAENIKVSGHQKPFYNILAADAKPTEELIKKEPKGLYAEISKVFESSRGCELPGMVNFSIVQTLFNWQSQNWQTYATEYMKQVKRACDQFVAKLLAHVCQDELLCASISANLAPCIQKQYKAAEYELMRILDSERQGLLTLDDQYSENLQEARNRRILNSMRFAKLSAEDSAQHEDDDEFHEQILDAIRISNKTQCINDIHDILSSYYQISRPRFVDNVAVQVVERHFLSRYEGGPVRCFSPEWVGKLTIEQLGRVAAEQVTNSERRRDLTAKLERFKEGREMVGIF